MQNIRLLVVEDEDFTRSTLCSALRLYGVDIVGDSKTASHAVALAQAVKPNAALVDLNLGPGPSGLDLAAHLRTIDPEIGIVILTSIEDPRLHREHQPELPAGAQWLVKRNVTDVSRVTAAIAESMMLDTKKFGETQMPKSQLPHLTAVQIETLRLVGAGFTNAEIAKKRFVSERSVEQTITRLAKTFGVEDRQSYNQRARLVKIFYRYVNAR